MKVRVRTGVYEWEHGTKPRGFGCWMFSLGRDYEDVMELAEDGKRRVVQSLSMTFDEARRWAAKVARERGFEDVVVCP